MTNNAKNAAITDNTAKNLTMAGESTICSNENNPNDMKSGGTKHHHHHQQQQQRASARWAILRNAIVKNSQTKNTTSATLRNSKKTAAAEGSIHQFPGFGLLRRKRIARDKVKFLKDRLTEIFLDSSDDREQERVLVDTLEVSLLALAALRPDCWVWEFSIFPNEKIGSYAKRIEELLAALDERLRSASAADPKHKLRLGKNSGWIGSSNDEEMGQKDEANNAPKWILRIVLAPFFPSHGIFQYTLPSIAGKTSEEELCQEESATQENHQPGLLFTRERLDSTSTSLHELTSHHHHQGVDNTGNIRVWDSEETLAYSLIKNVALQKKISGVFSSSQNSSSHHLVESGSSVTSKDSIVDILELGAGMAGLSGLALTQTLLQEQKSQQMRLWLTDGHPQAVQNNRVHARMMQIQLQNTTINEIVTERNPVQCLVLPWSIDPPNKSMQISSSGGHPEKQHPPCCQVALVSDCTHFQEFHAHLFLTLSYRTLVGGVIFLCQPHRGNSLERFLQVVRTTMKSKSATSENHEHLSPLFSIEWIELPEISNFATESPSFAMSHYDPSIHRPHLILLRKLREVQEADRRAVLHHMETRDR